MPGDFLLTGSVTQLIGSTISAEQLAALAGTEIGFTSNLPRNKAIPIPGGVMYVPARTAVVMSNGQLSENGVDAGIRLLADDPALGLANPVQWTIDPARVTLAGKPVNLAKWTFNAPAPGDDTSLEDLTPVPAVGQDGNLVGPRGYPVDDVNLVSGEVQFYVQGDPIGSPLPLTVTELDTAGDIVDRVNPRATPELWSAFAAKADGAAPANFDTGQAAHTVGSPTQTVAGGLLTATVPGASYYWGQLSGIATRVGGRFVFNGGSTDNGAISVAITDQPITSPIPDMSCHLVIGPTAWGFGVWRGPNNGSLGLASLASGAFATPLLRDGITEYEAEVWIDGNTATIQLPDGSQQVVTDSRIGNTTYNGPYVFFESISNAGTDSVTGFTHVWASSGKSKPAQKPFKAWRIVKRPTATSTTTIGGGGANIPGLGATFIAPPSGQVVVRIGVVLDIPTAATVYLRSNLTDGLGSTDDQYLLVSDIATTGRRFVTAEFVHTGLIAGHLYTDTPQGLSTQTNTAIAIDLSAFKRAILVAEPVY
jgi:hypothetical protein